MSETPETTAVAKPFPWSGLLGFAAAVVSIVAGI
jgi:hypothetical protein